MRAWVWRLGLVLAAVLATAPLWLPNSLRLMRLEVALRRLPHPPRSRRIAVESQVGLLQGNGNHCDFFAGELRAAPLTASALRAFYRASRAEVAVLDGGAPSFAMAPFARLASRAAGAARPDETRYIVWLFDQSDAGIDLRCH